MRSHSLLCETQSDSVASLLKLLSLAVAVPGVSVRVVLVAQLLHFFFEL